MIRFLVPALIIGMAVPGVAGGLEGFLAQLDARARADLKGFSAQVSAQFNIGEGQVRTLLGSLPRPSDAFMVLQLGQWSGKSVDRVLPVYRARKGQGWGAVAKDLGIKPGSPEFHALKRGDLRLGPEGSGPPPGKGRGRGKGRG